jgi:hypothetical protein
MRGHGQKLTRKQEALIAALLTERTHAEAAKKAGISEATLYRWLSLPGFLSAYRRARRELVENAVGRMQAATGQAVDTLLSVAKDGAKDSDRVRASIALLDHAFLGLTDSDDLYGEPEAGDASKMDTADVVKVLALRLRQIDQSQLSTGEKSRLTATLADALLRAISVDVLDKRLEAIEAVLIGRKDKEKK